MKKKATPTEQIAEKMREIAEVCKRNKIEYLSLCFYNNTIMFNTSPRAIKPIQYCEKIKRGDNTND